MEKMYQALCSDEEGHLAKLEEFHESIYMKEM